MEENVVIGQRLSTTTLVSDVEGTRVFWLEGSVLE